MFQSSVILHLQSIWDKFIFPICSVLLNQPISQGKFTLFSGSLAVLLILFMFQQFVLLNFITSAYFTILTVPPLDPPKLDTYHDLVKNHPLSSKYFNVFNLHGCIVMVWVHILPTFGWRVCLIRRSVLENAGELDYPSGKANFVLLSSVSWREFNKAHQKTTHHVSPNT